MNFLNGKQEDHPTTEVHAVCKWVWVESKQKRRVEYMKDFGKGEKYFIIP